MQLPRGQQPRLLLFGLAALIMAASPAQAASQQQQQQQQQHAASARAGAVLAEVQEAVRASYNARRRHSRENPPRDRCDEAAGDDCFGGDVECWFINACAWGPARGEMERLASLYDDATQRLRGVAAGTDAEALRWVEGQRVGAWTRLGEYARARAAVAECASQTWWCEALAGLVAHRTGEYETAEVRFRTALAQMPPGRACYWNELTLYHDAEAPSLRHGGSAACRTLDEQQSFWTLADPLFSRPGNDRMTEHFARHVEMAIHEDFLLTFEGNHTHAHHSTVLRLGWPTGFRVLPRLGDVALRTDPVHTGGVGLLVTTSLPDALQLPAAAFTPRPDDPTEQFRPAWGSIAAVPVQFGFVRHRGTSGLLVRAGAASADGLHWQLRSWDGETWRDGEVLVNPGGVGAWLETPWVPQLFSLEAMHGTTALRGRSGSRPPAAAGDIALSSVLLLDPAVSLPSAPDRATLAAAMLPGTTLSAGADAAAYWELYLPSPTHGTVTLATEPLARPGLLARLFRRAGPGERRVQWAEALEPEDGVVRRRMTLDVRHLPPGKYALRLEVALADGTRLNSATEFRVGDR